MRGLLYFWYLNERKVNSLFSQLEGRLETERKEQRSRKVSGKATASAEVGSILAMIGLAKGKLDAGIAADRERILEITSNLTVENRVELLLEYLTRTDQLKMVDLDGQNRQKVLQAVSDKQFQVFRGGFDLAGPFDRSQYELRSETADDEHEPVVVVPLRDEHFLPDQAVNAMSEGDYWPQTVFAQSIIRPGRIVASPVAIWFPERDADTDVLTYWEPRSADSTSTGSPPPASKP